MYPTTSMNQSRTRLVRDWLRTALPGVRIRGMGSGTVYEVTKDRNLRWISGPNSVGTALCNPITNYHITYPKEQAVPKTTPAKDQRVTVSTVKEVTGKVIYSSPIDRYIEVKDEKTHKVTGHYLADNGTTVKVLRDPLPTTPGTVLRRISDGESFVLIGGVWYNVKDTRMLYTSSIQASWDIGDLDTSFDPR